MLNKEELRHFGSGMLSDVFIDRVFEECRTFWDESTEQREMDYKTFLDFWLAMENKNSKQAIHYLWKLVDVHQQGWFDGFVINYFFRAIVRLLQNKKFDVTSVDNVKDEIMDMVHPKQPGIITLQDLINCQQGGTVLSMMIDAAAFWRYESKEQLKFMDDDDDDDMDI